MTLNIACEPTSSYDLMAPGLFLDPHPLLHKMRVEAPVHWSPELEAWVLTSYRDVDAALNDPKLSVVAETKQIEALPAADQEKLLPLRRSFEMWMGRSSEVDHDRFQKILRRHFTPAVAEGLRGRVQQIADRLIGASVGRGGLDVVSELAHPMAMSVVTELVLDTPAAHVDMFIRRSNDISGLLEMGEPEQLFRCQDAVLELSEHLGPVVERHRREGRGGVIGALLDAKDAGIIRSNEEIVANCIMFLVVGYHTTANLLCNGLQLLFEHPEQKERLESDRKLLPRAVDEMMRFHGPVASVRRLVVEDFNLRGKTIKGEQILLLALTAANRDPAVFRDPDRFDITREDNRHLGFTVGPYSCMGKALARIEAETFFLSLLSRFPRLRPRDDEPDWMAFRPLGHELRTLHVVFD